MRRALSFVGLLIAVVYQANGQPQQFFTQQQPQQFLSRQQQPQQPQQFQGGQQEQPHQFQGGQQQEQQFPDDQQQEQQFSDDPQQEQQFQGGQQPPQQIQGGQQPPQQFQGGQQPPQQFQGGQQPPQQFQGGQQPPQQFQGGQQPPQQFQGGQQPPQQFQGGQQPPQQFQGGQQPPQQFQGGQQPPQQFAGGQQPPQQFQGDQQPQQFLSLQQQPQGRFPAGQQQQSGQFQGGQQQQNYGAPSSLQEMMKHFAKKYNDLFNLPPSQVPFNYLPVTPNTTSIAEACPKNGFFTGFTPLHMDAVNDVRKILLGMNTTEGVLDMAMALRHSPDINPKLWFYALASYAQKNPDLQVIHRMSPLDAMPDAFIPSGALAQAPATNEPQGTAGATNKRKRQTTCVVLDERFGSDNGIENLLWYFRESIPVNAHHWYQHTMYPFTSRTRENRRGELFYFMHRDILARYNAERLSNGLARVQPIPQQTGALLEGYMAHLRDSNSGFQWTDRLPNTPFNDINHQNDPNLRMNIILNNFLFTARDRINQAIDARIVYTPNGQGWSLANTQGIDILGDIMQASSFSLNPQYFGVGSSNGIHGNGHITLSLESDPRFLQRLPPGVMADPATAMRDVIFYRWHAFMQQIFDRHKQTLAPYAPTGGQLPLLWQGVSITSFAINPINGGPTNQLRTFWSTQQFQLGPGLDFNRAATQPGNRMFCAKQLDHGAFAYQLVVNKDPSITTTRATVRIFLAPRFDEQGVRFNMTAQRALFFLLDSFQTTLNSGSNAITRQSTDSTLTIPWAQTLLQANQQNPAGTPNCGCGWPQNMLLPKGTPSGMVYDVFVMITNGDQDAISGATQTQGCRSAPIFCGITNQPYPDSKPMGYPFDRFPYTVNGIVVPTLDQYMAGITNMASTQITITFTG